MATPKSKRRSRKRRNASGPPRTVASPRRQRPAGAESSPPRTAATARRPPATPFGPYGERPTSPFGGIPVSEIAIFAGGVGFVVGVLSGGRSALIVGAIVCGLGVLEVTAREHFSGYRSHSLLLAAFPAVGVETAVVAVFGAPTQRLLLLVVVIPVFAVAFLLLRQRFQAARQRRIARLG